MFVGGWSSGRVGEWITMSASLPTSRLPSSACFPTALAPPRVAIRSTSSASRIVRSRWASRATRSARLAWRKRSKSLDQLPESDPSATFTPRRHSSAWRLTMVAPLPHIIDAAGAQTSVVPVAATRVGLLVGEVVGVAEGRVRAEDAQLVQSHERILAEAAPIAVGVLGAVRLVEIQDRVRCVRAPLRLDEQRVAGGAHAVQRDMAGDEIRRIVACERPTDRGAPALPRGSAVIGGRCRRVGVDPSHDWSTTRASPRTARIPTSSAPAAAASGVRTVPASRNVVVPFRIISSDDRTTASRSSSSLTVS